MQSGERMTEERPAGYWSAFSSASLLIPFHSLLRYFTRHILLPLLSHISHPPFIPHFTCPPFPLIRYPPSSSLPANSLSLFPRTTGQTKNPSEVGWHSNRYDSCMHACVCALWVGRWSGGIPLSERAQTSSRLIGAHESPLSALQCVRASTHAHRTFKSIDTPHCGPPGLPLSLSHHLTPLPFSSSSALYLFFTLPSISALNIQNHLTSVSASVCLSRRVCVSWSLITINVIR